MNRNLIVLSILSNFLFSTFGFAIDIVNPMYFGKHGSNLLNTEVGYTQQSYEVKSLNTITRHAETIPEITLGLEHFFGTIISAGLKVDYITKMEDRQDVSGTKTAFTESGVEKLSLFARYRLSNSVKAIAFITDLGF